MTGFQLNTSKRFNFFDPGATCTGSISEHGTLAVPSIQIIVAKIKFTFDLDIDRMHVMPVNMSVIGNTVTPSEAGAFGPLRTPSVSIPVLGNSPVFVGFGQSPFVALQLIIGSYFRVDAF